MAKMKRVSDDAMAIHVCTDESYKRSLQRGDGKPIQLFIVVASTPLGVSIVHVLADDEAGAVSQALYDSGFEIDDAGVAAKALRLPLRIRGWGHTAF